MPLPLPRLQLSVLQSFSLSVLLILAAGCQSRPPPSISPLKINGVAVGGGLTSGEVPPPSAEGGVIPLPRLSRPADAGEAAELSNATQAGFVTIPGVNRLVWTDLDRIGFSDRAQFKDQVDASLEQLKGAVAVARLNPARPGQESSHAAAIARLDESIRELERQRFDMETAVSETWEFAKDRMQQAWQQSETDYTITRRTGY